jgi:uncharacterized protein YkwD
MSVRPGARRRAPRRRRRVLGLLYGALLIPVAAIVAVYLTAGGGFQQLGLSQPGTPQARGNGAPGGGPAPADAPVPAASTAVPVGTPGVSRALATQADARRSPKPHASASPSPSASQSQSPPASPPSSGQQSQAINAVLALINQARSQAGLPAYTITAGLTRSSSAHNALMAGGCGLSHQCPGEPALGTRETDAGVSWTSAGENIGDGGPVSDTSAAIAQMATGLTQDMLNEKPPDDGHRLNILSSSFTHIGIAVTIDSSGTVWMTQDFSN